MKHFGNAREEGRGMGRGRIRGEGRAVTETGTPFDKGRPVAAEDAVHTFGAGRRAGGRGGFGRNRCRRQSQGRGMGRGNGRGR